MAYGNWDDVLKEYREIWLYTRSPLIEHAQSMIDLVPRIKDILPDVIPMTSHSTLCLNLPSCRKRVCIWGQDIGLYEVYVYDPRSEPRKDSMSENIFTTGDEIIAVIERCLLSIQEKAS